LLSATTLPEYDEPVIAGHLPVICSARRNTSGCGEEHVDEGTDMMRTCLSRLFRSECGQENIPKDAKFTPTTAFSRECSEELALTRCCSEEFGCNEFPSIRRCSEEFGYDEFSLTRRCSEAFGQEDLPPTRHCSEEFVTVNSTWEYSPALNEFDPSPRMVSHGSDVAPPIPSRDNPLPMWLPEFTRSEEGQNDRRGCQSPDPQQRGMHPSYFQLLQPETCTPPPQPSLAEDGDHVTDVANISIPRDCPPGHCMQAQDDQGPCLKVPCLPLSSFRADSDSKEGALCEGRCEGTPNPCQMQEGAVRDRRGEHSPDPPSEASC